MIFERAKFNTQKQEVAESANTFFTDLYCLAKHCDYGLLHNKMTRDCVVMDLFDSHLQT